jgi:hypothetical protein
MTEERSPFELASLFKVVKRAVREYRHNVIIIWGELGEGKTSLMLQVMWEFIHDWAAVISFVLDPHVCMHCGAEFDAGQPYKYEIICPECSRHQRTTTSLREALSLAGQNWWVDPFPVDIKSGEIRKFPEGQQFIVCEGKARGKIVKNHPYLNFSFNELRATIQNAVNTRIRQPVIGWDDVAVYFHRSNIQYMHPEVKNFFSRYSFVRQYIANLLITVPTIDFVPEQLSLFCTADILLKERGLGDFDIKRSMRNFYGRSKSFQKSYDGRSTQWAPVPSPWFEAYEEIRHAHAVEAFEHPEEIFVTTMPKAKVFTEEESLL